MKRYKRKVPLLSPKKIAIAASYAAIATATIIAFTGTNNIWYILSGGVSISLFIADLFIIIGAGGRYCFSEKFIKVFHLLLPHKEIEYSQFSAIVISNASYNNGYGYGVNGNIPMQYRVKDNNGHIKITFPFITLHKPQYPFDKIKAGMSSRDLFSLNPDATHCLGICWGDSFRELLEHTNCPVYVLEDVYLRFKEQFTAAFSLYIGGLSRLYIITDHIIAFQMYEEEKSV